MVNFEDLPIIQQMLKYGWMEERKMAEEKYRIDEEERQNLMISLQQTVVRIVAQQYPQLERLAKAQVPLLTDTDYREQLLVNLTTAHNSDEVQDTLLSLGENTREKDSSSLEAISTSSLEKLEQNGTQIDRHGKAPMPEWVKKMGHLRRCTGSSVDVGRCY